MFILCIDTFTVWHIKVLFLLSHPGNWFKEQKIGSPIIGMTGTLRSIIETAYPDLHAQRDFVEYICEDLFNKGFLKDGRGVLERGLSANTLMQKCTTNLGDQFINYITKQA